MHDVEGQARNRRHDDEERNAHTHRHRLTELRMSVMLSVVSRPQRRDHLPMG